MPLLTITLQTWLDGDDSTNIATDTIIWKLTGLLEQMKTSGLIRHYELDHKPANE